MVYASRLHSYIHVWPHPTPAVPMDKLPLLFPEFTEELKEHRASFGTNPKWEFRHYLDLIGHRLPKHPYIRSEGYAVDREGDVVLFCYEAHNSRMRTVVKGMLKTFGVTYDQKHHPISVIEPVRTPFERTGIELLLAEKRFIEGRLFFSTEKPTALILANRR